jgi:hypothetical protein
MTYQATQRTDAIHQGKMIVLGIGLVYLVSWILEFLTYPVFLVPGFLYDSSLQTFNALVILLAQLGLSSLFSLLLWAGLGWVRYLFGFYLLLAGLVNVVFSITLGAFGGIPLVFGAVSLVAAAAVTLSLSVTRYLEDRRQKGIPWLSTGLALAGIFTIVLAVIALDLFQFHQVLQTNRREAAFASSIMERFAPNLDVNVMEQAADADLKLRMEESGYADQCQLIKQEVGAFRSYEKPRRETVAELALDRAQASLLVFHGVAHYQKESLAIDIEVDFSRQPWKVSQLNVMRIAKASPE